MAGNSSVPSRCISYRRWTPVVVSSVTPLMVAATSVHLLGLSFRVRLSSSRMIRNSSLSAVDGSGAAPAFSNSTPLWISRVASPPSSRIMFGVLPSGQVSACSVHHQYSSSVSPFQAKTGTPCGFSGVPSGPTAMAAAAWSWVEKMLQEHQRTSAPSAVRVSIRTAVWIVMCSEPVMRAPASGCDAAYSARIAIRPGISCSASWISLRPNGARERSATLKSPVMSVDMRLLLADGVGAKGPGVCRARQAVRMHGHAGAAGSPRWRTGSLRSTNRRRTSLPRPAHTLRARTADRPPSAATFWLWGRIYTDGPIGRPPMTDFDRRRGPGPGPGVTTRLRAPGRPAWRPGPRPPRPSRRCRRRAPGRSPGRSARPPGRAPPPRRWPPPPGRRCPPR